MTSCRSWGGAWPPDLALWCGAHLRLVAEIAAQYEGTDLLAPVMRDQLQRRLEEARRLCRRGGEAEARRLLGLTC